jgi:hypothetical protein
VAGLTLDAGALIAFERRDWRVTEVLDRAFLRREPLTIPAPVLAQVWRGSQSARVAMLLRIAVVEVMTQESAKMAGELCAAARTSNVVDAAVVAGAARRHDDVVTSDPGDLRALASYTEAIGLTARVRIVDLTQLPQRR